MTEWENDQRGFEKDIEIWSHSEMVYAQTRICLRELDP